MKKIVHVTSVHQRYDTRIFLKMCTSLALCNNFQVSLIVADDLGDEHKNNVFIYDVRKEVGRLKRVLSTSKKLLRKALEIDADVYHLHDPELILMGLKLKKLGKIVVFDAHEDFPKQILTKHYLPFPFKKVISICAEMGERILCRYFDGIVGATPFITEKFSRINNNVINLNNYPRVEELQVFDSFHRIDKQICYIGGISIERGIKEVVSALTLTKYNVTLALAGKFHSVHLEQAMACEPGWQQTNFMGFVGRNEIQKLLSTTHIGIVTLYPTISYLDSLPIKLFEYMCAGIPVIASDFPLWRDIVLKHNCGLCVDPKNPEEIAKAIDYLIDHPDVAIKMGENGFKAIQSEFNWANEESKLIKFYENMIGSSK